MWTDTAGYIAWALRNGGVYARRIVHRFEIRGTEDGPVRLESIAVRVLDRRPPVAGVTWNAAAGGDWTDRHISADLDEADDAGCAPTQRTVDQWNAAGDDFVSVTWDLIDVSPTDVETFVVDARTEEYDCDFVIEVNYRGQYRKGKVEVTRKDGTPFRVSAIAEPEREVIIGTPAEEHEWPEGDQP